MRINYHWLKCEVKDDLVEITGEGNFISATLIKSSHALLATYWSKILNKSELNARQLSKRVGHLKCEVKDDLVGNYWRSKTLFEGKYSSLVI